MYTPLRGYTLLEMIVSVGIFSIVMVVAMGAYVTVIAHDRQARGTNELVNNLNFAVDSMARALRTGKNYACNANGSSPNCTTAGSSLSFTDAQGDTITYILKTDGTIGRCKNLSCTNANATPITSTNVDVTSLAFYVRGVGTSDNVQPQVVFTVKGTMTLDASGRTTNFNIESAATQRLIDL